MVVMGDARQYGDCVKCARGMLGLSYDDAAKLLQMSKSNYKACERRSMMLPDGVLYRLFSAGFPFLAFRRPATYLNQTSTSENSSLSIPCS